jgi:hypothetical protein
MAVKGIEWVVCEKEQRMKEEERDKERERDR